MNPLRPRPLTASLAAALACILPACGGSHHDGPTCTEGVSCALAGAGACQVGVTTCTASGAACQAVAAADGTSCGSGFGCQAGACVALAPLTVYWTFERHLLGGTTLAYDTSLTPGGTSPVCSTSGVDAIGVTDLAGNPLDPAAPTLPCVNGGVQGATFADLLPGTYDLLFTGYQGQVPAYQQQVRVTVVPFSNNTQPALALPGIEDDLDLLATFWNSAGTVQFTTCGLAVIDTLTYNLFDGAGTNMATISMPCADAPAPGLAFRVIDSQGLDRDSYTIRAQGLSGGNVVLDSATPAFGCAGNSFAHTGSDIGARAWSVPLYDVSTLAIRCL